MARIVNEKIVRASFDKYDWETLKGHLDEIGLNREVMSTILEYISRANNFIHRHPDPRKESLRDRYLEALGDYAERILGSAEKDETQALLGRFRRIEDRYRAILTQLENCEYYKLDPEERISASIVRAVQQFRIFVRKFRKRLEESKSINLPDAAALTDELGRTVSLDGIIDSLVQGLTITIKMEGHRNKWFASNENLVLPKLGDIDDDAIYKAGSIEQLALLWQRWENTEERLRFLGGRFEEHILAPENAYGIENLGVYRPPQEEFYDYAANKRFRDRLAILYADMSLETNINSVPVGIHGDAPLAPNAYVSSEEIHAAYVLSEILNYPITTDQDTMGGLRLIEWLRGFAVLAELSRNYEERIDNDAAVDCYIVSHQDLRSLLKKQGLKDNVAGFFCEHLSFKKTSRDLFDAPLIQIGSGNYLVFTPALIGCNLPQIIFSVISNMKLSFERKGHAFEDYIHALFKKHKLTPKKLKLNLDGEEYEFDALLPWNNYLFVFECKNKTLSGRNPSQAYYFNLGIRSACRQATKRADALKRHPEILEERLKISRDVKIVPCVLNSLPYARCGKMNGVYFYDASALTRFLQEREFHLKVSHRLSEKTKVLHRTAIKSLWKGDKPTPEDLLRELESPFQLQIIKHHTKVDTIPYRISKKEGVILFEFLPKEITMESMAEVFGASPSEFAKTIKSITSGLKSEKPWPMC